MKKILIFICVLILSACNQPSDETPRSFVRLVVTDTLKLRKTIGENILANKNASKSEKLVFENKNNAGSSQLDFGWITNAGSIIAYSNKFSVVILLEPVLSEDKKSIRWKCVIHPTNAKPNEVDEYIN